MTRRKVTLVFNKGTSDKIFNKQNQPEIVFDGITVDERVKWRSALTMIYQSLPDEHKEVLPPFYMHRTLLKAMSVSFDCDIKKLDDMVEDYLKEKVWAFSFMDGATLRNKAISLNEYKRIVFMIDRVNLIPEIWPVEFTVFHEIGHFVIRYIQNTVMTKSNEGLVEYKADEYGFKSYARLFDKFKQYQTFNLNPQQIEFEKWMKELVSNSVNNRKNKSEDDVYQIIANTIMEQLKWKEMYLEQYGLKI